MECQCVGKQWIYRGSFMGRPMWNPYNANGSFWTDYKISTHVRVWFCHKYIPHLNLMGKRTTGVVAMIICNWWVCVSWIYSGLRTDIVRATLCGIFKYNWLAGFNLCTLNWRVLCNWWSPRVRPYHCTPARLTLLITCDVGVSRGKTQVKLYMYWCFFV